MSAQSLTIPRLEDRAIIDCLVQISKLLPQHAPNVSLGLLGGGNHGFDPLKHENDQRLSSLLNKKSTLIATASYSVGGFNITIYRGGRTEHKSPYTDEVVLNPSGQCKLSEDEKLELTYTIVEQLRAFDVGRVVGLKGSEAEFQLAAIHESTLSRLEKLGESLIEETHRYRLKVDEELAEKSNHLDTELNRQKEALEDQCQAKLVSIEQKEHELEALRKSIDDKSNTHARRQLRKDIISEIKSRQSKFFLTDGTNKLRRPIAIAIIGLILIFCYLAYFSILGFNESISSNDIQIIALAAVKQLIYSFGAVGSILFYIRWQNRWFEQHSLAEFQLKQLELDMERASWVVETSLEWNDAKNDKIPAELLESLTRNLFREQSDKVERLVHPADQLASALVGSSSIIRLKAGDSELEIDPKKLQKKKTIVENAPNN